VRITTIGRGNVGGGLGERWRRVGHEVVEMGREGGDASGSDAVLLAVPQTAIADALASVSGLAGVPVIDAINAVRGPRPGGFESLAEYVKSLTGGPVAKAFNANFATLYDRIGETRATPSMVYAADDGARDVTETLIRDAGFEPVSAGGLESARAVEDFLDVIFASAARSSTASRSPKSSSGVARRVATRPSQPQPARALSARAWGSLPRVRTTG
jgi:predicted dinucleotide-binding enzyme